MKISRLSRYEIFLKRNEALKQPFEKKEDYEKALRKAALCAKRLDKDIREKGIDEATKRKKPSLGEHLAKLYDNYIEVRNRVQENSRDSNLGG